MAAISSIAELEACVGVAGLPVKMKIIDHLDAEAARWIAASPLAFVGFGSADGPTIAVAGGLPGFATVTGRKRLTLPRAAFDVLPSVSPGQGAGLLFLAPGVGETLRANGQVTAVTDQAVEVAIEECFVHCAKALIRSAFWAPDGTTAPLEPAAFVNAARFLALATMDAEGRVDVSPKGDPAGLLMQMDGERICLAERPGNRLAFGYHNIVAQPRVAAVALIPGSTRVALLSGDAKLTTDERLRGQFVVDGKTPILATVIDRVAAEALESPALARAAPWAGDAGEPEIDAAAVLVAHVKLNKARGVQATLLKRTVNRSLVAGGLKANYKSDLY